MKETEQVWSEFSSALRDFIRRRVRDDHVADDLLQDVFVRIHDKLDTLEDDDRLQAWVFRIARNAITDYYRRHPESSVDAIEVESDEVEVPENMNAEVGQWILDRVEGLPPEYRQAINLSELQGAKQSVIAEKTGLSLSGAKSRVQRGRKMLKDKLLECCHFEFDRHGNILDYHRNQQCCICCSGSDQTCDDQSG